MTWAGSFWAGHPTPCDQLMLRYLSDGTLDTTFGTDGSQLIDYGSSEDILDLVLQPDGRVLGIGTRTGSWPDDPLNRMAISRFGGTFFGYVDDATTFVSSIDDPAGTSFTYDWQLARVPDEPHASGTDSSFTFTPDEVGLYLLELTVTNDLGHVKSTYAYLNAAVPDHNVAPKNLQLSATSTAINEGGSTALSGSFQDANPDDTHHVVINWSDGSAITEFDLPAGVTSFSDYSHTYLDNPAVGSTYTISVTVTDASGEGAGTIQVVTVSNRAPTAMISGAPVSSPEGTTINLTSASTDPSTIDQASLTLSWSVTKNGVAFVAPGASRWLQPYAERQWLVRRHAGRHRQRRRKSHDECHDLC